MIESGKQRGRYGDPQLETDDVRPTVCPQQPGCERRRGESTQIDDLRAAATDDAADLWVIAEH